MIIYIENPKDATRKLLELINKFGKIAGYKINTQKSLVLLYNNNKRLEREIKGSSHHGSLLNNLTSIHEDTGLIPGPALWVKDLVLS